VAPYLSALGAGFAGGGRSFPASIVPITLFTLKQALLSTLFALLLGLPGAWFGVRRRWLRALTGIPFAMPPILVVLAFVLFFGNSGWVNRFFMFLTGSGAGPVKLLYRPLAVVLAHGFYNFPIVVRLAGDGIARARGSGAVAGSLGASPPAAAATVILPLAIPSILAAALLVFLYCFTSFAVVLVLGGGPAVTTLAVEIYRYARISLDFRTAGLLALTETLLAVGVFLVYTILDRAFLRESEAGNPAPEEPRPSFSGRAARWIYAVLLLALVILPLCSIPLQSVLARPGWSAPAGFSLQAWRGLGERALPALGRSLFLAGLSATLACLIAVLAAALVRFAGERSFLGRLLRFFSVSPLASSGVVLGLGWLMLYGRAALSLPTLAAFHAVISLPFAFNSLLQGYRDVPANTANAAMVMGAGPFLRFLTVEIPLALGRLRSAWAFSAAISLGELNGILMLGPEQFETLPLLIYRAAGAYRYGPACAAGTLLMVCCAAALLLAEGRPAGILRRSGVLIRMTHRRTHGA
jgi:thiamine transport system permease protein